jgi:hypothetical protein
MSPKSVETDTGRSPLPTGRGHGSLERVTVNLTPRSSRALDDTVALTGDSKTDTINRALQVYAYLEEVTHRGGDILIRTADSAEVERLKIF